jgi:hypothetical protein
MLCGRKLPMDRGEISLSFHPAAPSLRPELMKLLFSWLMVFCVMSGLNVRVIGADHSHLDQHPASMGGCCEHEELPAHPHDDGNHDGDCHHHHCCVQAQPMTMESEHSNRLAVPASRRLALRHEGEFPPEKPFLSSEKPPLI